MSINETLAHASNDLVYSAMAVYTVALGAYAVDLADLGERVGRMRPGRSRASARTTQPARTTQLARASQPARSAGARVPVAVGAGPVAGGQAPPPSDAGSRASTGTSGAWGPDGQAALGPRRAARIATSLTVLAFGLHVGGVVARGLSAHRAPWGNMYEFTITGSAVVSAVYLAILVRRDLRYIGAFVVGPVLLALGLAVGVLYTTSAPLVPALQSYWLVIHVSVAFVSSALFTLASSTTVLQLVQDRRETARAAGNPPVGGRFMDALPSAADLERTSYRLIAVSFPLWAFTLVAGSIWAEAAWGRYWNWDPKEVWTFIIWIVYAAYLHARATGGWSGRRSAYIALAGFACLLVNWGIVNVFFPGEHSYAGIG